MGMDLSLGRTQRFLLARVKSRFQLPMKAVAQSDFSRADLSCESP